MALQAGRLDRRARIEQKIVTRDDYLAEVISWQEVATVWAGKRDLSGREFFAADAVQSEVTTEITIRWRAGIGPELRLVLDGAAYDIESVTEIGRREGLLLRCTRGGTVPMLVQLRGALAIAGHLAGGLRVERRLSGGITGGLALAGDLKSRAAVLLSGDLKGALLLAGRLFNAGAVLSGTVTGALALSGGARVEKRLSGDLAGGLSLDGAARVARHLAGALQGGLTLSGDMAGIGAVLSGMVTGALALSGAARVEKRLSGDLAGGLSLDGAARVARHLAGTLQGGLALSGDLTVLPGGDTWWDMVSLSVPMDGENGATDLEDVKYPWRDFTRIGGTAALDTAVKKYGNASLSVGSASYFRCDSGAEFDFGSGDFTVEAWYRRGEGAGTRYIVSKWSGGSTVNLACWALREENTALTFAYFNSSNTLVNINPAHTPVTGAWRHVAVTRAGGTFSLYFDGVRVATQVNADVIRTTAGAITIGGFENGPGNFFGSPCHIDDVRVTKGVARYTGASYTVPDGPHAVGGATPADPDWADVSLLLPMDGVPGGTDLADAKLPERGFSRVGSAAVRSTAQARFGNASLHCLSSSYFSTPDAADLRMEDQDFTIECWLRRGATSGTRVICGKWRSNEAATPGLSDYVLFHDGTNTIFYFYAAGGVLKQLVVNQLTTLNAWQHLALVRAGSSFSLYFDGVRHATQLTDAAAVRSSATAFTIGGWQANDGVHTSLDGFIDDLRVTKGLARYTGASFTPPARPHPTFG